MNQSEITENNKIIAQWMGGKQEYDAPIGWIKNVSGLPNIERFELANGKYHESWDWLMPVVEKIMRESISRVVIYPPNYSGFNTPDPECWKSLLSNSDIGGMNSRENLITSIYENVVYHIKMSNHGKQDT